MRHNHAVLTELNDSLAELAHRLPCSLANPSGTAHPTIPALYTRNCQRSARRVSTAQWQLSIPPS